MANTANSKLTTNFNVTPYYDDYDESKGYYRILYKPGFAVQGRELTQMQTILQKQVDRFGKHIFREGSIVLPENFNIKQSIEKIDYVKVNDVNNANTTVNINDFLNKEIRGLTNNVSAYIVNVADGSSSNTNTKTLFVRYLSGSNANTQIKTFAPLEVLSTNAGANLVVLDSSSTPTGQGTRFVLTEGVLFAKEHFIRFEPTSAILSRYTIVPTCRVGFNIVEEIINYSQDASLLDPALEASNYSAPGADRLKLTPNLEVRDIDDTEGSPNFAELFSMREGILTEIYDRPQYNILRDELAKRTFDESGDYYVNGLTVRVRENLDNNVNGGYSFTGANTLLSVGVEPGTAYVKGYEVSKLVTDYVTVEKALTYGNVTTQFGAATMGSYVIANEVKGKIELDKGNLVYLYDTAQKKITNKASISGTPTGSVIGTARVLSFDYVNGTLGTNTGNVAIYLTDIRMNGTNSFTQTRTIYASGFFADPIVESNGAVLRETATSTLLYSVGSQATRSVKDSSGIPSLDYIFKKTSSGQSITGSSMNFSYSGSGEDLLFAEKSDIIVTLDQDVNVSTGWTVTSGAGTTTLGGGASPAFTRFNVGDKIQISGNGSYRYTITNIGSDSSMTLDTALPAVISSNLIFKSYMTGDILDLNAKGLTGGIRTVTGTSPSISIDFKEDIAPVSTVSATITYQVARGDSVQIEKVLVSNAYVVIDLSTSTSPVTGPFNLGIPDIYKLKKVIRKTGSLPFASTADGEDVTRYFTLDNGQRDTYYEHGAITPTGIALTKSDKLLVEFDYFEPNFTSGRGYFSVDSYPVNTIGYENIPIFISPSNKIEYDLRNFIDFRPIKTQTATKALTPGSADSNPALSSTFNYEANGIRFPAPSSTFDFSYSYFLPRRDIVVIDKDGFISIVKGNPGANPITPTVPENVMALASLYIAPYPSLAPNYAQIINRKDLSVIVKKLSNVRFTMRDIGVLRDRIVNLEYYASLTTLEKSAVDMQIVDENNLNRFKNGIFVDSFRDHSLGDITDPNYRIVVDPDEKSIRPIYNMRSDYYDLKSNTNLNVSGDLVHLPYTDKILIEQSRVTSYRNVEYSSYRFLGNLYMTPDIDVWVDTQQLADNQVVTGANIDGLTEGTTTEWNQWQTNIVGYKLYRKDTGQLLATFNANERDLAYNNAYWLARNVEFNKNTIGLTSSGKFDSGAKFESIVETVYQSTRTGTESFLGISEDTQQLGNKVIDVSIQPYIRPQTIACNARGMKATTRLYVFFDGENMTSYVTPLTESEYNSYILNRTIPSVLSKSEGAPLDSDSSGNAYFLIRLPTGDAKRFRVGQKEVVVIDSPTKSEADATTLAKNYFVAEGLTQQKQNTILTTRTVITTQKDVSETNQTTSQFIQQIRPSCSAYSFIPKAPDGEEGVFLTKVDLFFAQKHPTLGFWIEIREMDSGGGITRNQVPLSEVWVNSNDPRYNVSIDDPTVATTIRFPAPVFLYNNVQYALVIHTIGLNPDTYIWVSRISETDKITKQKVDQRPLTGTFFTTNNNLNWIPVDGVDLKVKFYRASFTTNVEGNAILGQKPVERFIVTNPTKDFTSYGETIVGNQRLTLSGGTITGANVGNDWFIGLTSGANAVVSSYAASVASVANINFLKDETVRRYYGANGVSSGQTSTIASIDMGLGRLDKFKVSSNSYIVDILSSNGKFRTGETIRGLTSNARANLASVSNFRYSVIDFEPSFINFNKTEIAFEMATLANNETTLTAYSPIDDNENYYFTSERRVLSRSNEETILGAGESSNKVKVRMSSSSEYMTPILDLAKTHTIYVDNVVNANTYQETYTGISVIMDNAIANVGNTLTLQSGSGYSNTTVISRSGNTVILTVPPSNYASGNTISILNADGTVRGIANVVNVYTNYTRNSGGALYNRYISRPIVLAEGQDAEDILVVLTAYRPADTDVPVWIRIQNNEDSDVFSTVSWIKMEMVDSTAYSSSSDKNDFREYTYKFPTGMMTAPSTGAVQYTNSQGITFTGFKTFALKIGLQANNSAIVPRVADLRAIALQM